jgi:2-polyprenyl-3-methyl-5-hydroxy-6-metoxy-1,4-benzoquinol methylase
MERRCPNCESDAPKLLAEKGRATLFQCRQCSLVFKPQIALDEDRVQEIQDGVYHDLRLRTEVKTVYKMAQDRLDLLKKHQPVGSLLEVGCATGEFIELADRQGFDVLGVDASNLYADYARSKGLNIRNGRTDQVLEKDETFDAIAMFHLLEHIPAPTPFLISIGEHLKPGGTMIVVCPNLDASTRRPFGFWHPNFQQPDHLLFFSEKTLTDLFERSGFKVIATASYEYPHSVFSSLRGYLALRIGHWRKNRAGALPQKPKPNGAPPQQKEPAGRSLYKTLYAKLPYLLGTLFYPLLRPYGWWLEKRMKGHELVVLVQAKNG